MHVHQIGRYSGPALLLPHRDGRIQPELVEFDMKAPFTRHITYMFEFAWSDAEPIVAETPQPICRRQDS